MKMVIFAVLDLKVGAFMEPFAMRSYGEAERLIQDLKGNKEHPFGKHPEDYVLHQIGEYQTDTGIIAPLAHPKIITA